MLTRLIFAFLLCVNQFAAALPIGNSNVLSDSEEDAIIKDTLALLADQPVFITNQMIHQCSYPGDEGILKLIYNQGTAQNNRRLADKKSPELCKTFVLLDTLKNVINPNMLISKVKEIVAKRRAFYQRNPLDQMPRIQGDAISPVAVVKPRWFILTDALTYQDQNVKPEEKPYVAPQYSNLQNPDMNSFKNNIPTINSQPESVQIYSNEKTDGLAPVQDINPPIQQAHQYNPKNTFDSNQHAQKVYYAKPQAMDNFRVQDSSSYNKDTPSYFEVRNGFQDFNNGKIVMENNNPVQEELSPMKNKKLHQRKTFNKEQQQEQGFYNEPRQTELKNEEWEKTLFDIYKNLWPNENAAERIKYGYSKNRKDISTQKPQTLL